MFLFLFYSFSFSVEKREKIQILKEQIITLRQQVEYLQSLLNVDVSHNGITRLDPKPSKIGCTYAPALWGNSTRPPMLFLNSNPTAQPNVGSTQTASDKNFSIFKPGRVDNHTMYENVGFVPNKFSGYILSRNLPKLDFGSMAIPKPSITYNNSHYNNYPRYNGIIRHPYVPVSPYNTIYENVRSINPLMNLDYLYGGRATLIPPKPSRTDNTSLYNNYRRYNGIMRPPFYVPVSPYNTKIHFSDQISPRPYLK